MADNWPEGLTTVGYQLAVTSALTAKPGKMVAPFSAQTSMYSGNRAEQLEDRFDEIALTKQLGRAEPTHYSDLNSVRRWLRYEMPADTAMLLERFDQHQTQVDLKLPSAQQMAKAVARYHDNQFFSGFYGNAWQGTDGPQTAIPFTPANIIAHGGTGITKAKLQALQKLYDDNDVDTEDEMPIVWIDTQGRQDLLNINEYVNSDFQDGHTLVRGEVKPWLNFRFVMVNFHSPNVWGTAQAFMQPAAGQIALPSCVPSAMKRGVWQEFFNDERPNPERKHKLQRYVEANSNFTRTDEKKCFQLVCTGNRP